MSEASARAARVAAEEAASLQGQLAEAQRLLLEAQRSLGASHADADAQRMAMMQEARRRCGEMQEEMAQVRAAQAREAAEAQAALSRLQAVAEEQRLVHRHTLPVKNHCHTYAQIAHSPHMAAETKRSERPRSSLFLLQAPWPCAPNSQLSYSVVGYALCLLSAYLLLRIHPPGRRQRTLSAQQMPCEGLSCRDIHRSACHSHSPSPTCQNFG